jgi:hypothetical protein
MALIVSQLFSIVMSTHSRHGFLALQGLEVPLMVLQSKVFLIVLLQKYTPSLTKRRTLIRRMKTAMTRSWNGPKDEVATSLFPGVTVEVDEDEGEGEHRSATGQPSSLEDIENGETRDPEITQTEAMRLFTKIPFPVPKRVIHIKPRVL